MLVRHRLLRLLRLVVTLVTLFTAQPSRAAVNVIDRIVLVAATPAAEIAPDRDDTRARRVAHAHAPGNTTASNTSETASLAPLQSTRALRDRAYLLNCALLC